jgi:hypothetical protein
MIHGHRCRRYSRRRRQDRLCLAYGGIDCARGDRRCDCGHITGVCGRRGDGAHPVVVAASSRLNSHLRRSARSPASGRVRRRAATRAGGVTQSPSVLNLRRRGNPSCSTMAEAISIRLRCAGGAGRHQVLVRAPGGAVVVGRAATTQSVWAHSIGRRAWLLCMNIMFRILPV